MPSSGQPLPKSSRKGSNLIFAKLLSTLEQSASSPESATEIAPEKPESIDPQQEWKNTQLSPESVPPDLQRQELEKSDYNLTSKVQCSEEKKQDDIQMQPVEQSVDSGIYGTSPCEQVLKIQSQAELETLQAKQIISPYPKPLFNTQLQQKLKYQAIEKNLDAKKIQSYVPKLNVINERLQNITKQRLDETGKTPL